MGLIVLLVIVGLAVIFLRPLLFPRPDLGAQELAELQALYDKAKSTETLKASDVERYVGAFFEAMELDFTPEMRHALWALMMTEQLPRDIDLDRLNLKERIDLRQQLVAWEMKNKDEGEWIKDFVMPTFVHLAQQLPKTAAGSPFKTSLANSMTAPGEWISQIYYWLVDDENMDADLFGELRQQMFLNLCHVSDIDPSKPSTKKVKHAVHSDLPHGALADAYLRRTPFYDLFKSEVPLRYSYDDRFSHTHIVGGTGAGKTTLLESLILHDIKQDDPPSLVVIDPHSDLIRKLTRTDVGIEDRLILIDPRDVKNPPALNIFALNKERMAGYDDAQREQVVAGVIETYEFLFSGFGIDLTGKQQILFRNVARLMLALPDAGVIEDGELVKRNATILDMMNLMRDAAPYRPAIESLPPLQREFFERDFVDTKEAKTTFKQTKEEIRYRLQAVLENPTMARLFTSAESKLDLFAELNAGSIILVDTAEDFLKGASADYGRVFITLILQAILERSVVEEAKRKPTFIYIDEAASFFSQNISKMLTDARKYKAGLVLSHQFLEQATPALRASLAANTATKFVSGLSAKDASAFATDMRTTTDFILNQPRYHFAAHIRGVTPQAISVPVVGGAFNEYPDHSLEALTAIFERNRKRVSLQLPAPSTPPPHTRRPVERPLVPDPDPDRISDEW